MIPMGGPPPPSLGGGLGAGDGDGCTCTIVGALSTVTLTPAELNRAVAAAGVLIADVKALAAEVL